MVSRQEMEISVKTKINDLLINLEQSKQKELQLKDETITNIKRFREEDKIVDELEKKLTLLEKTLLETEKGNDTLRKSLLEKETDLEAEKEFHLSEKTEFTRLEAEKETLSDKLKDACAVNTILHKQAKCKTDDIVNFSKEEREEESLCDQEEKRYTCLQKELDEVDEKLSGAQSHEEAMKENKKKLEERVEDMLKKQSENETKADELDLEASRLEKLLESLTEKLDEMTAEHLKTEACLREQRQMASQEVEQVEQQLKRSDFHQAQCVKKKK